MTRSRAPLSLALVAIAACTSAQSATPAAGSAHVSPLERAAATITEADVRRRIELIADDSMLGRNTPSPELDKTAAYIADEFRRLGLKPGGDSGTFIQRYEIGRRRLDARGSSLSLSGGAATRTTFADGVRLVSGIPAAQPVSGPVHLLGGAGFLDSPPAELDGAVVLVVLDHTGPAPRPRAILSALAARSPKAIVIVSNRDEATFGRMVQAQARERLTLGSSAGGGAPAVYEVADRAIASALGAAGVDLAQVRASAAPVSRPLAGLTATLDVRDQVLESAFAPNTVGILEGSDPVLRNEYVVYSAHMDHVGYTPGMSPDSIFNGADDDASGTAGVLELAEAFAQEGARPKRSIIFLTVSGEEKGLWGSEYYAEHPSVPVSQMVANINLDMIGRNWKDTIVAIGKEHSDLGATLERVNAAHPELRMNAIDDRWPEENFYFRSDHFNFARKGVPILFFFNGVHPDYHQVSDSPDKIDAEKEARIVKLLFYLGQEIANAPERPKWNPESYRQIVEGAR